MGNLQQTINWAQTQVEYVPLTAGLGQEPAVSAATAIRDSFLSAPMTWYWNRASFTLPSPTTKGTQDYNILLTSIPDFGFLEKVALTDPNGKIWEIKDIYNSSPLSQATDQQRPNGAAVQSVTSTNLVLRFIGVPNAAYTVAITYQKKAQSFGPFFITAAGNAAAGNTAYTGTFDPLSFPTGSTAIITGFVAHTVNNGSFVVVSCTTTTLTVANAGGVAETISAFANNFDWAPIPDYYRDIYNNLFLSEMMWDDPQRAQIHRQRGVGAFLAKAQGLNDMQKNAFAQQWMARSSEEVTNSMLTQIGNSGRGV